MDKGRFALLRKRAKSKIKTEEKFKKMLISSRIQLQKIPLSALRFTHLRTLAKLSPMIVKTFL